MLAYLTDDLWLRSAQAANAKLQSLVRGLRKAGAEIVWEPQANLVFARLTRQVHQRLIAAGAVYYIWDGDPAVGDPDEMLMARFVCDWSVPDDDIARFLDVLVRG